MTYGEFSTGFTTGLNTTGYYFDWIVGGFEPAVDFLYDNLLTNPIFYGIVLVIIILSILPFRE